MSFIDTRNAASTALAEAMTHAASRRDACVQNDGRAVLDAIHIALVALHGQHRQIIVVDARLGGVLEEIADHLHDMASDVAGEYRKEAAA